ncbi:unnamed protein product [Pleuronectes platessa]|uniref:C2H2-type domain-containing protein n=1 Tax=Pleuronectes platessa TaxID=8262 RepID=A0A9N7U044_PLEPL|nr:unnamed protein product [Pleuronectes platessa]
MGEQRGLSISVHGANSTRPTGGSCGCTRFNKLTTARETERKCSCLWRSFYIRGDVTGPRQCRLYSLCVPMHHTEPNGERDRFYPRKRGRPKKEEREEDMKTPGDEQSPVLMETESELSQELEAPYTRSVAKEAEALTQMAEAEKEASTVTSQKTSSPDETSPLVPAVRNPVVVLQPLILQAGGYQFQLCSRDLTTVSQPVEDEQPDEDEDEEEEEEEEEEKFCSCSICGVQFTNHTGFTQHRCIKPEETSFPCNMCDRSLTSYHCLKRHKLLHVKDGRKCGKCGVLFCRRHNHTPFRPATDFKEASSGDEVQPAESNVKPENGGQQKSDLSWTPGAMTVTRNYEYILSKSKGDVKIIKEEPSERSISPVEEIIEQIVEPVPIGRIAYDLEIVV